MRRLSKQRGVSCSFCNKSVESDGAEIMGLRLHRVCANNLAAVLAKVKNLDQLKAQSRERTLGLTA